MGGCLCKSKTSDDLPDNLSQSGRHSADYGRSYGRHSDETLSETVDRLVKETLKVIGSVVDSDPEPPNVCFPAFLLFLSSIIFSVYNTGNNVFFFIKYFLFSVDDSIA